MNRARGFAATHETRIVVATVTRPMRRSTAEELAAAGFAVCGVEESAEHAIAAALAHRPDVFVVAADLPGSAVIAVATVAQSMPNTRVVVVADAMDDEDCLTFLLAGASAYVTEGGGAAVASAVRAVVGGAAILPPSAQRRLVDELRA